MNEVVKDKQCHEGWDEEFQSWVVDEDKVCDRPTTLTRKARRRMGVGGWKLMGYSYWMRLRSSARREETSLIGMRAICFRSRGLILWLF